MPTDDKAPIISTPSDGVTLDLPAGVQFSRRLKALRKQRGLSQEQLAEKAGLTAKAVYLYESGKDTTPRRDNLVALSKALDIKVVQLCPFFSFVSLKELLHERLKEEVEAMDIFVERATEADFQRLEHLLAVYDMSTGVDKLEIDLVIHRTVTGIAAPHRKRRLNTLVLQFFSQIDEFLEESGLLEEHNEAVLANIHRQLGRAVLDRDPRAARDAYVRHLRASEEFVFDAFGGQGKTVLLSGK